MILSRHIIVYALTAAVRDKLILAFTILIVVGTSLSIFLGSAAVTESGQFSLVFSAGGLRIAGVLGIVLFVVFHMRRSFESKDVDYLLTRPITRVAFLLSHSAAFSLLAIGFASMISLSLFAAGLQDAGAGFWLWGFSLIFEYIIIANAALFFSMVLPNAAASALSVFGLYLLSRLMGQLLGIIDTGVDLPGFHILAGLFQGISFIVPRLDLFAQTSWLLYGPGNIGYMLIFLQGILYAGLLIAASLVDLVRRQF